MLGTQILLSLTCLLGISTTTKGNPIISPHDLTRIVGGTKIQINEAPYQVQVLFFRIFICGGSILSERYILTAAHCVDNGFPAWLFSIRSGSSYVGGGGVITRVSQIIIDPSYIADTLDRDVAVLQLSYRLLFNRVTRPIRLSKSSPQTGQLLQVTGWGAVVENGTSNVNLNSVVLRVTDKEACNSTYEGFITKYMFCAFKRGKDACQGDSGGAVIINGTQVGIVSWGSGCASPWFPSVYVDVSTVRNFINKNTNKEAKWINPLRRQRVKHIY